MVAAAEEVVGRGGFGFLVFAWGFAFVVLALGDGLLVGDGDGVGDGDALCEVDATTDGLGPDADLLGLPPLSAKPMPAPARTTRPRPPRSGCGGAGSAGAAA